MLNPGCGEQPVHLIVHHEQRPLARTTAGVLLEHQIADVGQLLGLEGRAGRIERRVQREEPSAANDRAQKVGRRQEVRRRVRFDGDDLAADHVDVVVVVPLRHAEHHAIAAVDKRPIDGIDDRSGTRRRQNALERKVEAGAVAVELANRLAQRLDADPRRIVRLAGAQRVDDPIFELARNRELLGVEVADREVGDRAGRRRSANGLHRRSGEWLSRAGSARGWRGGLRTYEAS